LPEKSKCPSYSLYTVYELHHFLTMDIKFKFEILVPPLLVCGQALVKCHSAVVLRTPLGTQRNMSSLALCHHVGLGAMETLTMLL